MSRAFVRADTIAPVMLRALLFSLAVSSVSSAAPAPLLWGGDSRGGAPFVFQDPMDPTRVVGFEVEIATKLAERLGTKAQPVQGQWDRLLELLVRGDIDIALNGIEVAEEKKRIVALSHPYFATAEVLTVRKNDTAAPRTLEALAGKKVGSLPGSLAERIAQRWGAEVRTYEGQDQIYEDLKLGRTDAVLLDDTIATYYGELDDSLETIRGDFGVIEYAVALRLDDEARLVTINAAIDELIADGTLRTLYERWGLWTPANAALFKSNDLTPHSPPLELERWRIAVGKLPPFFERLTTRYPSYLGLFLQGAGLTLLASVVAMLLAIALGVSLAVARRFGPSGVRHVAVAYVEFFRGTPLLVQLTMIYFGLPELGLKLDPFAAGVVALGLNYAAAEAENYRAGLEAVPRGQLEAAQVLGLSTFQTLRLVLAPQAIRIAIPPMTNDFIALLKDSSLVSLVTLTELTKTYTQLASSTRDHLGLGVVVAVLYLMLGLPFAVLARRLEARFARHLQRSQS